MKRKPIIRGKSPEIAFDIGGQVFAFDENRCTFLKHLNAFSVKTETGARYLLPAESVTQARERMIRDNNFGG